MKRAPIDIGIDVGICHRAPDVQKSPLTLFPSKSSPLSYQEIGSVEKKVEVSYFDGHFDRRSLSGVEVKDGLSLSQQVRKMTGSSYNSRFFVTSSEGPRAAYDHIPHRAPEIVKPVKSEISGIQPPNACY